MAKYSTEKRRLLLAFFQENLHKTFSAAEIANALKEKGISTSAIYRNLAEMERDGLLCRVSEPNGQKVRYQYIDPECCSGILHLVCSKCDATYHMNRHISHLISDMAFEDYGFKVNPASALIYGCCEKCAKSM